MGTPKGVKYPKRGFASMDRSKQREIASKGGRAGHEKGTAHEWVAGSEEHLKASAKGGRASRGGRRGRLVPTVVTTVQWDQPSHDAQLAAARVAEGSHTPVAPRQVVMPRISLGHGDEEVG